MTIWGLLFLPSTSPSPSNSTPSPSQPDLILHLHLSPRTPSMKLREVHSATELLPSDTGTKWNSPLRKRCLQSATMSRIIHFPKTKKKKEDIVLAEPLNKIFLLIPSKPKKSLVLEPTSTTIKILLISIPAFHSPWGIKPKIHSKGIKM